MSGINHNGFFKDFLDTLRKKDKVTYDGVIFDPDRPVESVSTGSYICDLVTGTGGLLVKKRISEISGLESCVDYSTELVVTYEDGNPIDITIGELFDRLESPENNGTKNAKGYQIQTPDGFKNLLAVHKLPKKDLNRILFSNGDTLLITSDHLLRMADGSWGSLDNNLLTKGSIIKSVEGDILITHIYQQYKYDHCYDLTVDTKEHNYYANGIESHNCGKTTICLQSAVQAQKAGWRGVFIDTEQAFDYVYARALGLKLDYDSFLVIQPLFAEEAEKLIDMVIDNADIDYIIIDSLAAMRPESQVYSNNSTGEGQVKAAHASFWAAYAMKLQRIATENNVAVLITNQLRQKVNISNPYQEKAVSTQGLGSGFSNDNSWDTTGGTAIKFYFSLRCTLNFRKRIYEERNGTKIPIGNIIDFKNVKNKLAPPYSKASFFIRYQKDEFCNRMCGTDDIPAMIDFLADQKALKKTSHKWTLTVGDASEDFKGRDHFNQLMYNDSDYLSALQMSYKEQWEKDRNKLTPEEVAELEDDEVQLPVQESELEYQEQAVGE